MKPARLALFLTACLVGSALILTTVPASSGPKRQSGNVRSASQQHRSAKFWRHAMKTAKPMSLRHATRRTGAARPASEDGGAPNLVPPTGPAGTEVTRLPEVSSFYPRGQGGFPPVNFTRTEITDPSQQPFRRHGKIFFVQNGSTFVCSGTIVTAANESLVATAGHCVFDEATDVFNSSTIFVPGYKNGSTPFGIWDATQVFTTNQWKTGDFRYDVGMVKLETQGGQSIQDLHGSRGIAFNQAAAQLFDSYGYPANTPFNGELLYRCDSNLGYTDPTFSSPAPNAIGCDMNQGSSGGGWVATIGAVEVVNSVNSYLYQNQRDVGLNLIYGPYFGTVAENLYNTAAETPGFTPSPDPTGTNPVTHVSNLTLQLKNHLKAKGAMSPVGDSYMPCSRRARVGIYKLINPTTGQLTGSIHRAEQNGSYSFNIPDRKGKYFANVNARNIDSINSCAQAQSGLVRHRH